MPQPSQWCLRGEHDRCPHWTAMKVGGLWRLRPRPEILLCDDPCHRRRQCPLAGRRKVARDEWSARCTCPGAEATRRSFARSEATNRERAAVLADVDLADHPDGETIERRLRAAFDAHGERPPPGLARFLAAATGRRGTRSVRLLGLGLRVLARGLRRTWRSGPDPE